MRQTLLLLLIIISSWRLWTQTTEKHELSFNKTPLSSAINILENQFNIKYNYLDKTLEYKVFTLRKGKYSLQQIHIEVAFQCNVTFEKIDSRIYSIKAISEEDCVQKVECLAEVVVKGYLSKGINKNVDKTTVLPDKMGLLPGVPDADILLTLQQLPGVLSPNETASGLHIRGGNIDQNLILWDGIKMQHPGHLFGMISGYNPIATQHVNYYFKGTPPRLGERISSVIELKTYEEIPSKTQLKLGVNGLNFDFLLRSPLVKNQLSLEIGGRKSYTEWWQTPTFHQLTKKVFQHTDFKEFDNENNFKFYDFSMKLNFKPRPQTEIFLSNVLINNDLDFTSPYQQSYSKNDAMQIMNGGSSLVWNEKWSEKLQQNLLIHYSIYDFNYHNLKTLDTDFEKFTKLNRSVNSGLELNFKYLYNENNTWEMGYQMLGNDVSHAFTTKNTNFELVLDNNYFFNLTHVLYFLEKWYHKKWNIQAGFRYNYYQNLNIQTFEPRFLIQNKVFENWSIQMTYEQKSQLMSQIQESVASDLSLENYVWVLANNADIPLIQSHQISLGSTYKNSNWLIDLDLYYKPILGITSIFYGFYNPFETEIHQGKSYSTGLDVLIQKETSTWKTTFTYSFLNAKNKFDEVNENEYFPMNSEIKHNINLNLTRKWNRFAIALGWNWHSGKPFSVLNDDNQIVGYNSNRLPNYHRLDISGLYTLKNTQKMNATIGFSIFNVYNHNNALSKELQYNYSSFFADSQSDTYQQNYSGLGFTPNVFLKIKW